MKTKPTAPNPSPFDWRSTPATPLTPEHWKASGPQSRAQFAAVRRVAASGGDLIKSASHSKLTSLSKPKKR
jgi:hypothetical protein